MKKQQRKRIFLLICFIFLISCGNNHFALAMKEDDGDDSDSGSKIDFSYYHTTQQIFDEMDQLTNKCNNLLTISQVYSSPDLRIAHFNQGKNKQFKSFLLFGEHPREMISSETGIHLLKALCKQTSTSYLDVDYVLENYEVQIMVNANPISRDLVEKGDYCKRQNENNVDINRNYDAHWEYLKDDVQQVSSGDQPFSEIQTQKIRDIIQEFKPLYFLTVHSGTYGLYTPYAYEKKQADFNEDNMMSVMKDLQDNYCNQCHVGSAAKEVGYLCPGTCLDYAYENQNVKYSFAVEIFNKNHADENAILLQTKSNDKKTNSVKHESCFTQFSNLNYEDQQFDKLTQQIKQNTNLRRQKQTFQMSDQQNDKKNFLKIQSKAKSNDKFFFGDDFEKCFLFFNPNNKDQYDQTVDNWTKALLRSLKVTADIEKGINQNNKSEVSGQ